MRDYTKIEAWRLADDFTVAIYERTRTFPREELYGLTSQLRRAASSAAADIVEDSAREGKKDHLHFLYIARGSLTETQYFVHLSERLGYLAASEASGLEAQGRQAFACLYGLIRAVAKDAGKIARFAATITSLLVLGLGRFFPGNSISG